MKRIRVSHVITGLSRGGAETALFRLLKGLNAGQFDFNVVSMTAGGLYAERIADLGIPVHCLDMRPGFPDPMALWRLHGLIKAESPDVVQAWMYHAALASLLAAPSQKIVVAVRHSLEDLAQEKFLTRQVVRATGHLAGRASTVTYNSWASRAAHESAGYPAALSRVIPNGFDCERFRPMPEDRASVREELGLSGNALVVGHLGRYHPVKEHGTLLEAFARLAARHDSAQLVLAGTAVTSGNPELSRTISALGIGPRVRCLGERDDAPRLMNAFDLLASASRSEAFPNTLGEAMATGVPCVATDVGDSAAVVGDCGAIVAPRDTQALFEGMDRLAGLTPSQRARLGERARARVLKHFSLDSMLREYAALYETMTKDRASGKADAWASDAD